jgi:D-glycero-D-manno-heptose 1,7-bisphosphate phosphatase
MPPASSACPAVFFDRDGVLNVDRGYVARREDWEWVEGAPEAIRWCNEHGTLVFVVTNQSGIARGYYAEEDFHTLMADVAEDLRTYGAHIDDIRYCPHLPEGVVEQYAIECGCRKPKPGMIESLVEEWNVDRARSLLFGDSERDLAAGRAAGVRAVRYEGGRLDRCLSAYLTGSPEGADLNKQGASNDQA